MAIPFWSANTVCTVKTEQTDFPGIELVLCRMDRGEHLFVRIRKTGENLRLGG